MISSYTLGIYPRSEELIEATRKNSSNLSSLFLKEKKEYIALEKKAKLGFVCDPLLEWDDIFRPFAQLNSVKAAALNRIYEMNTFYRRLSFNGKALSGAGKIVKSNLAVSLLPKNRAVCLPEPYTFAERHVSSAYKKNDEFAIFLAKLLRKEIDSLTKAGFKLIQLIAPSIAYNINKVDLDLVYDALNIVTKNLKAKTILHFYFGDVSKKIGKLLDLPVSGLGFDTTSTPISSIKKHSFSGKALAVGLVNSYNTKIENKKKCISEMNQILSKTKPEEAFVTTNFDLEYIPKEFARKKILILGQIASGVRNV
ncbi:MAG: 5-methyltetrahydropteroyltriglutamate--homocysteine methyltransferase [Nitrosopumilales archaeon]|nr:MAG: 5-methyltetrahydropteroyltriglutamate--homocysteine methyltransferase [Nitrosopumilales archaeon]